MCEWSGLLYIHGPNSWYSQQSDKEKKKRSKLTFKSFRRLVRIQALIVRNAMRTPARSLRRDGGLPRGWPACTPSQRAQQWSNPIPSTLYGPNARALRACVVFGEWEMLSATPPPHNLKDISTQRSHRRLSGDSYFIVLQQESVNCVTALQYARKTWVPLHKQH